MFRGRIVSALRALLFDVHSAVHAVVVGTDIVRAHAGFSPEAISATMWLADLCSNTWSSKMCYTKLWSAWGCVRSRGGPCALNERWLVCG